MMPNEAVSPVRLRVPSTPVNVPGNGPSRMTPATIASGMLRAMFAMNY